MSYRSYLERIRNIDLVSVGQYYSVDRDILSDEKRAKLDKYFSEYILFSAAEIDELDLWSYCNYAEFNREDIKQVMNNLMRPADHYLVIANNCRWNGETGYKIVNTPFEAVHRNYDTKLYPEKISAQGKTLVCRESSQDVPTGAKTVIVALTEKEYLKLKNSDWDDVIKFAEEKEKKCA